MAISSPGLGSNLDVNGIVQQLMSIEQQPVTKINQKESGFQAKLSAIGSLKSVVSSLQSSVTALSKPAAFEGIYKASSADSTVVTASASKTASNGSFNVEVEQLAEAQKLASAAFTSTNQIVGHGKMTLQFGTYTGSGPVAFSANADRAAVSINIDSSKSSLGDIRDAINKANAGVSAAIVNDGSGFRLAISSSNTGIANAIRLSVEDADGGNTDTSGLSRLFYDPTIANGSVTQTSEAKDAKLKIDGISVTKSSNTITDAVSGISMVLQKKGSSSIAVSYDQSNGSTAIQAFTKAYNDANKALKEFGAYDPKTKQAGPLLGDASLRSVQTQIRSALQGSLQFAAGGLSNLADIGLSFQRDGSLALDNAKFQAAANNPEKKISTLFAGVGLTTDSKVSVHSAAATTPPGKYAINVTQAATQGFGEANVNDFVVSSGINDEFSITLDNVKAKLTLSAGNYTPNSLAGEIQSRLNGLSSLSSAGISVNVTTTGSAASLTGGTAANLSTQGGVFDLSLNGVTRSVTLPPGPDNPSAPGTPLYTSASSLATALQTAINSAFSGDNLTVTASADNNGELSLHGTSFVPPLTLTLPNPNALTGDIFGSTPLVSAGSTGTLKISSNTFGENSKVSELSSPLLSGFTATDGSEAVATIGGVLAKASGQLLTAEGPASGIKLKIEDSALGDRGYVTYEKGFAARLNDVLSSLLSSKGPLDAKTSGVQTSIKLLDHQREALGLRLTQIEARYRKQFTSLDVLMAGMTKTSSFLTQQLTALKNSN